MWLARPLIQKQPCCIRIGRRNDYVCANISTIQRYCLPWTNEIRCLGTYIVKSRQFRCSMDHSKSRFSFCRCNIWLSRYEYVRRSYLTVTEVQMYSCVDLWLWMLFITKKWYQIVRLGCYSISDEIVQDVQYGNNSWMSALFRIFPP